MSNNCQCLTVRLSVTLRTSFPSLCLYFITYRVCFCRVSVWLLSTLTYMNRILLINLLRTVEESVPLVQPHHARSGRVLFRRGRVRRKKNLLLHASPTVVCREKNGTRYNIHQVTLHHFIYLALPCAATLCWAFLTSSSSAR